MLKLASFALAIALCTAAVGQSRVSMGRGISSAPAGVSAHHFGFSIGVGQRNFRRPFSRYAYFPYGYGVPYVYPGFYPEDYGPYEADYRSEPAPQPASIVQEKTEPLPDPVLLELHGSQWVKVNFGEVPQRALNSSTQIPSSLHPSLSQTASPKELPPAVLVYRDGHSEEVTSYSIIGRVLYTKSDYYSSGSWSRTIQISDLDLPATLKQNQQRGVKFDLPSGPDEVVIRP